MFFPSGIKNTVGLCILLDNVVSSNRFTTVDSTEKGEIKIVIITYQYLIEKETIKCMY